MHGFEVWGVLKGKNIKKNRNNNDRIQLDSRKDRKLLNNILIRDKYYN